MSIFQAVILGLVQGLAEFLPISSSGHLLIFNKLFELEEPGITFDVLLHVATLVPVMIIFRGDIIKLIRNPFQKMTLLLVSATVPTVVAVLLFGDFIDELFDTGRFLAVGFFLTGALLLFADSIKAGKRTEKEMGVVDALIIGLMQCVGIPPGVSRSGATITGALTRRLTREAAAKFVFLMSIPAILGAAVLEVMKIATGRVEVENMSLLPMMFGFAAAALSGYLAIAFMLKLIKARRLRYFSYYVFTLAILILVEQFVLKTGLF
jgi:undecaprenyl-diphosphatase